MCSARWCRRCLRYFCEGRCSKVKSSQPSTRIEYDTILSVRPCSSTRNASFSPEQTLGFLLFLSALYSRACRMVRCCVHHAVVCVALFARCIAPVRVAMMVSVMTRFSNGMDSGHVPVLRGASGQRARPSRAPKRSLLQRGLHGGMYIFTYARMRTLYEALLLFVQNC